MDSNILQAIKKGEIVAIIPARAGSKGVKAKNIRNLRGYPMMAYSIATAQISPQISRIIVSTDSEDYAKIARFYGAETPFLRPAELAGDNSTDIEFMRHVIQWLYDNEGSVPEYFVHLRPTYPVREQYIVEKAIEEFVQDDNASSLRSAHLSLNSPFKWFMIGEDGYYTCMKEGMTPDDANQPRQSFPNVYIPDGYVDVLRTSYIVENEQIHGTRCHSYIVPDGVDVDALKDLSNVEEYLKTNTPDVLVYLQNHYKTMEEAGL